MVDGQTRKLSYVKAIGEGLLQAMVTDDRVFLMGEGVDNITGIYGTILPAYKKFGPDRVIDTPLSENGLTGFAIGAALDGQRPVLFHQRNDFMLLTMDQLVNTAAKLRYVSAGRHRVPMTVVSFIARKPGEGVQHSQSLQALFAYIPGLKVIMPATAYDAKGMLISAIQDDDPVIVLFHRSLFEKESEVPESFYTENFSTQVRVENNTSVITIVTISAVFTEGLQALYVLKEQNVFADLIDLRSIRPLDINPILESVKKTGRLLVVDTGWKSFGVSAEILASVVEGAYYYLKSTPRRIGMAEMPCPATPYLLDNYHPTTEQIVKTVQSMLQSE